MTRPGALGADTRAIAQDILAMDAAELAELVAAGVLTVDA
jgi:hypothetical protein